MRNDAELEAYYGEARSWDADRAALARRTERMAWRVAGAGWVCALGAAVALVLLMPLKRVEPFVVRVDNTTGVVDVVPVYEGTRALDDTVTRYFLSHYVTVCERFNFSTAESDYQECGAFHSAERNALWYAQWNRSNPASPLNLHRDGSSVRVEVESVSFFERANGVRDLAQVRYARVERIGSGAAEQYSHWIATVRYAYGPPAKDPAMRRWNPLGFRVLEFRPEAEVRPPEGDVGNPVSKARAES